MSGLFTLDEIFSDPRTLPAMAQDTKGDVYQVLKRNLNGFFEAIPEHDRKSVAFLPADDRKWISRHDVQPE